MKTTLRILSLLVLISLLIGACSSPAAPSPAPVETQKPAEQPAETQKPVEPTAKPPEPAKAEEIKLVIWWWGEQEAPGAQKFMDETIQKYQEAHPNVKIEAVLQSTDALIPSFQSAAAAKQGPDIQYFWGGVWTLENAWSSALIPLDDLIPADEMKHYINNFERSYDGKQWGIGWYLSGNPMVFNPDLFKQAGLDPQKPIQTWDELKDACAKLNAINVTPIAGGLKDGWFGGWLFSILSRQTHDSFKEFMDASVGNAKFTDPKFAEWWGRMAELRDAGCWNKDINSLDYQQGQDLFVQGKAAMIFGNDTFLKGWADTLTWEKMNVMLVPKYGSGKMADEYITTAQGWGITSWSQHPKEAADFLMFLHSPDRLSAWYNYTGVLPADDRLEAGLIKQPILQQIYKWDTTIAGANLENFIPSMLDEQSNYAGMQLLFAGDKTPEELAKMAEDVITKWREQNPDAVKNFTNWAASFK